MNKFMNFFIISDYVTLILNCSSKLIIYIQKIKFLYCIINILFKYIFFIEKFIQIIDKIHLLTYTQCIVYDK